MNVATRAGGPGRNVTSAIGLASVVAVLWGSAAFADTPVLNPGSQRYRAATPSSATGRSGSAALEVRALLGKNGTTSLEITTGKLDTAEAAPGKLSRVQVKLLDQWGGARHTHNHNRMKGGGYVHLLFPGLGRGQPLQVQGNVEGIDGARTGVVTVQTTVLRRPDLAATDLSLPETARMNTPVAISAVIKELHGDVSTRSDCVLRVGGAEVDRAPGIWIAGGDSVSCAFTTVFPAVGKFAVSVHSAGVLPGDDDATNNTVAGEIRIEPDARSFAHQASVVSITSWTKVVSTGFYSRVHNNKETGSDWGTTSEQLHTSQSVAFRGQLPSAVAFPLTRFALSHWSDATQLPSTTFLQLLPSTQYQRKTPNGFETTRCAWVFDPNATAHLNLCSTSGVGAGTTSFSWSRYGGKVTYFSTSYRNTWTTDLVTGETTTSGWISNGSGSPSSGASIWQPGSEYRFDVEVIDGPGRFRVTPTVPLTTRQYQNNAPFSCSVYSGSYYQESCYGRESSSTSVSGTFFFAQ